MKRRSRDQQMDAEFADHLAREAADLAASGVDPAQARRLAALRLGAAERWKEEGREARRGAWLESWLRDLRLALRGLRRAPAFAALAILILAFGIGANTAIFSVVEAVLLRPLPFAHGSRLQYVWETDVRRPGHQATLSYPDFLDLRTTPGFAAMAAYSVNDMPLTGHGPALHVRAASVSDNIFSLLGTAPASGRGFLPGEDRPGSLAGADAAVLTQALAQQTFGSAAAALGQPLTLDGRSYRVVGVMPAGFQFPLDDHENLWTTIAPLTISSSGQPMTAQRGAHFLEVVARLSPSASAASAQAALTAASANLARRYPDEDQNRRANIVPMLASYTGNASSILLLLFGAVGCVLLIACVNVAGLMLARAARRRHEFALRAALGASRRAILRQLLCESLMLGLLGAAAGLGLAQAAVLVFIRSAPQNIVRLSQARLSPPVMLFALAAGLGTALLFGLFPALELARGSQSARLSAALQSGGRSLGGVPPRRWRRALVAVQFGLALVVLIGALLLLHSLTRLLGVAPGFSTEHVLMASINLPDARYPAAAAEAGYFDRLTSHLSGQPGIAAAAAAFPVPLGGDNISTTFDLPRHPLPSAEQPSSRIVVVTPSYFAALAIPLRQGRSFTSRDVHGAPPVALVNLAFVRQFLAGGVALGRRVTPGISTFPGPDPVRQIVGVVGDTKMSSLAQPAPPIIYLPAAQVPFDGLELVVRARPGAESLAAQQIRAAVTALDPAIPLFDLRPMAQLQDHALAPGRFNALLLALFAALALLLATIGLYAVMSQAVAQRLREIGIRIALGANRGDVAKLVLREGMAMAAAGIGVGLVLAAALSRTLTGALGANLFATSTHDAVAFLAAPLLLLGVAAAACLIPARRAAAADPVASLRES